MSVMVSDMSDKKPFQYNQKTKGDVIEFTINQIQAITSDVDFEFFADEGYIHDLENLWCYLKELKELIGSSTKEELEGYFEEKD